MSPRPRGFTEIRISIFLRASVSPWLSQMPIRQITIIGTGLIGGSFGLALKKRGFPGRIVGCDRAPVLKRARRKAPSTMAAPTQRTRCAAAR